MEAADFVGRPTGGGAVPADAYVTDDQLAVVQLIPGVATPHAMSAGVEWAQLPTVGTTAGASPSNGYGQLQAAGGAAGPPVGSWVEWKLGAPAAPEGEGIADLEGWRYLYLTYCIGPNLGTVQWTLTGEHSGVVDLGTSDFYSAQNWPWAATVLWLLPGPGARPEVLTLRMTVVARNPAASDNYVLIDSLAIAAGRD